MTFASFSFVIFFPIVVALYYLCPMRFRWALLLLASCYFYIVYVPQYILVLFALVGIDFVAAQQIESSTGHRRRIFFLLSIVANIGILFVFKYFNFFNENVAALAHLLHWNYSLGALSLLLPLGLSFHTFQSLSYVTEVYRGKYKAERHLGIYALYVMFFPQLVAGPIERPQQLLPQLKNLGPLNQEDVISGLRLMTWGFFKKLVVADRLAVAVDYVWGNVPHASGGSILITALFFSFQLYTDFSAYSDIARGSARVLGGIKLINNFQQPYFSASIAEFWRRWHISLSSWFRDYLFTPLALNLGRRSPYVGVYISIFITFVLMGLWHGANWTYIVMGALFGFYIIFGMVTKRLRDSFTTFIGLKRFPRVHHMLQVLITFVLTSIAWVFFRSPTLHGVVQFMQQGFVGWNVSLSGALQNFQYPYNALGFSQSDLLISIGAICLILGVEYAQLKKPISFWFEKRSLFTRAFIYAGMIITIAVYGVMMAQPFIYFQF